MADRQNIQDFICSDGTCLELNLRVSNKAKNQRLTLNHKGVLEVVVPAWMAKLKGFDFDILAFVELHRGWIERAAKRTHAQREAYEMSRASGLPTHLDFPLANELWLVEYQQSAAKTVSAKPDGLRRLEGAKQVHTLKVRGNVVDESMCKRALVRFVAKRAKELIPSFALAVCHEIGASPRGITVNNRKSAWGICTHAGDIRIDRKVLFFPVDMARQVVMHEAAHLKHLNHSKRFYDELFSYEGSSREAEKAVKNGAQLIPAWVF